MNPLKLFISGLLCSAVLSFTAHTVFAQDLSGEGQLSGILRLALAVDDFPLADCRSLLRCAGPGMEDRGQHRERSFFFHGERRASAAYCLADRRGYSVFLPGERSAFLPGHESSRYYPDSPADLRNRHCGFSCGRLPFPSRPQGGRSAGTE